MTKRVVILGAMGMAGHVIRDQLSSYEQYQVVGIARTQGTGVDHIMDVTNFTELHKLIRNISPDILINCVGVLVSESTSNLRRAITVNAYLPNFLASTSEELNFKLIHISTDCVFSGKEGGYSESSFRDGDDNYARTKALGEIFSSSHLTIRTSIIGPELKPNGTGLMHWFFSQSKEVEGYARAYWTGVTTLELAKAIHCLIEDDVTGLLNLCPTEKISKFDLLKLINATWSRDVQILKDTAHSVDKSLISDRPGPTYATISYPEMLQELKTWMLERQDQYTHYA